MRNSQTNKLRIKQTFIQLLAGGLFAIFFINTLFCFIFFEFKRVAIRHEIKHNIFAQLTDSQLVAFQKNNNLDKDEFEYEGVMYDVVREKIINGKVVLLCFEDKKETQLNLTIESSLKKGLANSPIKNTEQKLIIFLKLSFIPFQKFDFCFLKKHVSKQFVFFQLKIISSYLQIIAPPPDFK